MRCLPPSAPLGAVGWWLGRPPRRTLSTRARSMCCWGFGWGGDPVSLPGHRAVSCRPRLRPVRDSSPRSPQEICCPIVGLMYPTRPHPQRSRSDPKPPEESAQHQGKQSESTNCRRPVDPPPAAADCVHRIRPSRECWSCSAGRASMPAFGAESRTDWSTGREFSLTHCPTHPGTSRFRRVVVNSHTGVVNPATAIHGCPEGAIGLTCPGRVPSYGWGVTWNR